MNEEQRVKYGGAVLWLWLAGWVLAGVYAVARILPAAGLYGAAGAAFAAVLVGLVSFGVLFGRS